MTHKHTKVDTAQTEPELAEKVWTLENANLIADAPETAAERDKLKEINAELLKALEAVVEIKAGAIMPNACVYKKCIEVIAKAKGMSDE